MGFITDAVGITGSGPKNNYNATAPTDSFQAQGATLDQSNYKDAIEQALRAAMAGGGNSTAAQQSALAQALQQQAAGNGPSLAQRQLETATQANNAQAAGAVAGVKGINPALAARLITQQQAANNQAAAGQSATTRLSEQLNTQGLLASALQAQRGQDINQQQANTSLAGAAGGLQNQQNATAASNALGTQQINASVAEGNANRNLGAQQINAGVQAQNANTNAGVLGGLMQGGGALATLLAGGGEVPGYAIGGDIPNITIPDYSRMLAEGGDALRAGMGGGMSSFASALKAKPQAAGDYSSVAGLSAAPWDAGSGVPFADAAGSPLTVAPFMARGGPVDFRSGGKVPGKAPVEGDSPANDTVPAMVSPGEVVLPRSVTQAPDAEDKAAQFVAAIKAKKKAQSPSGYGHVLATQRALAERIARLEKMADGGEVKGAEDKPPPPPPPGMAEKIAATLPAWLSGYDAVKAQRARQAQAYAAGKAE